MVELLPQSVSKRQWNVNIYLENFYDYTELLINARIYVDSSGAASILATCMLQ